MAFGQVYRPLKRILWEFLLMKHMFFFCLLTATLFFSCQNDSPRSAYVLGTLCTVNAFSDGNDRLYDELFSRLEQIDDRFSLTKADSDISRINRGAGIEAVTVHDEVFFLVKNALAYAAVTEGAFDPTIGAVTSLWGFNSEKPSLPKANLLSAALPLVDYKSLVLDEEKKSVFLTKKGMALDLGGIAKGYAADQLAERLRKHRVKRAIIDLGGNILTYGTKADGSLWRVGIKNPLDPTGEAILVLSLSASAVVTSGVYERNFEADGIFYHHIINPKTGFPVENDLLSVTVICDSSMKADALTTALFVLGKEKGMDFAKSQNLSVVFIDKKGNIIKNYYEN